jgi:hypothetical protein
MTVTVHMPVLPQEQVRLMQNAPMEWTLLIDEGGATNVIGRAEGKETEIIAGIRRVSGRPQPGHQSLV